MPRLRRRSFLQGVVGAVAGAGLAGVSSWLLGCRGAGKALGLPEAPEHAELFPAEVQPLLFAAADAIVPRFGEHPAASEIDLVPRLRVRLARTPRYAEFYRGAWPEFDAAIRARVPLEEGSAPDPEALTPVFEEWYREFRRKRRPSLESRVFERLRRDVLRVYYESPAGWASVGYTGPAHRPHPRGAGHGSGVG